LIIIPDYYFKRFLAGQNENGAFHNVALEAIQIIQGILSVPGIAGYKLVPARIGRFYKYKIFFS